MRVDWIVMLAAVEAHEALVAGVLGLAALFAYQRRGDPIDRLLALGVLWICVTGVAGLPLAEHGDPWRIIRLALRLTGPPILLFICEDSVRTVEHPGSRKTSIGFAIAIWIAAVGGLIWAGGGTMFEARFDRFLPLNVGVTAWMAILAVTFAAALLTIIPAGLRQLNPGLGGFVALLLLTSEAWAAIDPRWGSGAVEIGFSLSYRTLFTLVLAGFALLKAFKGFNWLNSAGYTPSEARRVAEKSGEAKRAAGDEKEKRASHKKDDEKQASKKPAKGTSKTTGRAAKSRTSSPGKKKGSRGKKKRR